MTGTSYEGDWAVLTLGAVFAAIGCFALAILIVLGTGAAAGFYVFVGIGTLLAVGGVIGSSIRVSRTQGSALAIFALVLNAILAGSYLLVIFVVVSSHLR